MINNTTQAAVITETGSINNFTVETSGDTNIRQFDPALGTLTSATVTLTGEFTPAVNFVITPPPATVTFTPPITFSALQSRFTLPTQTVEVPANGRVVGAPEAVDISGTPVASLSTLTGTGFINDVVSGNSGSNIFGPANIVDVSTLTAQITYTFTYTPAGSTGSGGGAVPEPASLALLGVGVLGLALAWFRGRRPASA